MNETYIQVSFFTDDQSLKDQLIAALSEIAFDGFEEIDKGLNAFINMKDFDENIFSETISKYNLSFEKKFIEEQNWNALWESSFEPVVVDDFVAVRAGFHQPIQNVQHEIIITPKMSFGTGHHATTFLMMQQMRDLNFAGKDVFDFGTGTGILSILAEKLGAAKVSAIDNDEWSIDNAKENIAANNCNRIDISLSSNPEMDKCFDIILANINKNIILENISSLANQLMENGQLLVSGLLYDDEEDIKNAAENCKLKFIHTIQKEKWICIKFCKLMYQSNK